LNKPPLPKQAWRLVLMNELRSLIRDRRALFAGLVLPALLYPFMFLGQGWITKIGEETLEAQEARIGLELSAAPDEMAERLIELLEQKLPIQIDTLTPGSYLAIEDAVQVGTPDAWQQERDLAIEIIGTEGHVLLYAIPDPDVPDRILFRVHFDGADEGSREAMKRVRDSLTELQSEWQAAFYLEHFGSDPALRWTTEELDLASEADKSGLWLGRLLPLIAVLVLLSGGSYAALAAFAGEREAGTLETLLVQPVPSVEIGWGKFGAVLVTGLATLGLNTGSLFLCAALGLTDLQNSAEEMGNPSAWRVLGAGLLFLPVCLLLSAVLCLVCSKARSFREGQHYVLPLSLVSLLPTALAMSPEVELDAFLACIPLAGPALAFRQAMVGGLTFLPGFLACSSTLVYAWFALRKIGDLLDGEKVLASQSSSAEEAMRKVQSRSAIAWGWAGVFAVYLIGGLVQSVSMLWGLMATLWIMLPLGAYYSVRATARRANESIPKALGLRMPSPLHAVGALLLAPVLARLASTWIEWQQQVMPLPSSMTQAGGLPEDITSLSSLGLFLVLALSPGICEELFFRGAVLSGLKRDLPAWKTIMWQALLFGAVHASIYRFVPTAFIGALLAAMTLRSRSLLPAIILHTSYNGLLVLTNAVNPSEGLFPWLFESWVPFLAVPAALLLLSPAWRSKKLGSPAT
jgi:sodium transport system permease protein